MAYASVGTVGTQQEKTLDTTLVLTTSATVEVGNLLVVWVAFDNVGTTTADDTTQLSIADSAGNTWTKIKERTFSAGASQDGVCVALFMSRITTQLTSGGTITVTTATNVTAMTASAWEFTTSAVPLIEGTPATASAAAADPAAITLSGLTSREYLLLHLCGSEGIAAAYTQDADYSTVTSISTSGGGAATNMSIYGGFRIATLTTDTVDVTLAASDHAQLLAAIYETAGAASPPPSTRLALLGVG